MSQRVPEQAIPSSAYNDEYWDNLTDAEIIGVSWYTNDPRSLPNIVATIPDGIREFQVEIEYKLDQSDQPVACGHCRQHTNHWHGFVIRTPDENRYLLGSVCGPKAYGADYKMASSARNRAKRRYDKLVRWMEIRGQLPDLIDALSDVLQSASFKDVRRVRAKLTRLVPRLAGHLAGVPRDTLTQKRVLVIEYSERDLEAEERRDDSFRREAEAIVDLPSKQHRLAMTALRERLMPGVPIMVHHRRTLGELPPIDWLLATEDYASQLEGVVARLRGYCAVGAQTQGKSDALIESYSRSAQRDLELAMNAIVAVRSAGDFFLPQNLERLVEWDRRHHPSRPVGLALAAGQLVVPDPYSTAGIVALGSDWTPPGDLFLELMQAPSRQTPSNSAA